MNTDESILFHSITSKQFAVLMQTIADNWNEGNARKAADCYTEDGL